MQQTVPVEGSLLSDLHISPEVDDAPHGMSPPSQMSERVRTLRLLSSSINNEYSEDNQNSGGVDQSIDLHDIQNTLLLRTPFHVAFRLQQRSQPGKKPPSER